MNRLSPFEEMIGYGWKMYLKGFLKGSLMKQLNENKRNILFEEYMYAIDPNYKTHTVYKNITREMIEN